MTLPVAMGSLATMIQEAVETAGVDLLAELLRGRRLPAVGDNLSPAEILQRAVWELEDPRTARRLSPLLASLIERFWRTAVDHSALDARQKATLGNAVRLAAGLPADPDLSRALRVLLNRLEEALGRAQMEQNDFAFAVWNALVYQQVDESWEERWLAILWDSAAHSASWTPGHRTLLLIAWRGLLWIPPPPGLLEDRVIDFDRVHRGLLALAQAVDGYDEAPDLLRQALDILTDTFPRSPEFWIEHLDVRQLAWPPELRRLAAERWPPLTRQLASARTHELGHCSPFFFSGHPERRDIGNPCSFLFDREESAPWRRGLQVSQIGRLRNQVEKVLLTGEGLSDPPARDTSPGSDLKFFFGCSVQHSLPAELVILTACSAGHGGVRSEMASRSEVFGPAAVLAERPHREGWVGEDAGEAIEFLKRHESALFSSSLAFWHAPPALPEEVVLYRKQAELPIEGLAPASVELLCRAPEPASYLKRLYELSFGAHRDALAQLRQRWALSWNALERSYLTAILTLVALKDEDFRRALQELESHAYKQMPLDVEFRVLELHASAGAGDGRASRRMFESLAQDGGLSPQARDTLQLLDAAYGLSRKAASQPAHLHQQIIDCEAGMLKVAGYR